VPWVCLAAAFAWERGWQRGGVTRAAMVVVLGLVLAQAAVNFSPPLRQEFPANFKAVAAEKIRRMQATGEPRQLVVIHADHLLGRDGVLEHLPAHETVLAAANPLQFTPYLFEGFTEGFRQFLRERDIRMRLIALTGARFEHPADVKFPHPGAVRLTLRLPPDLPNHHEPLLVTGSTGVADLIYVVYELPGTIRLGFDHWGVSGFLSEPVAVDYDQPVVITLSTGPLHETPAVTAGARDWRRWLHAEVNGRLVWSQAADFHPASPETIFYGRNYLGGSTCGPKFSGTILNVESVSLSVAER